MRTLSALAIATVITACSAPRKERPAPPQGDVAEWAAVASASRPDLNDTTVVDLQLQVSVTDGWHVYSLTQDKGGPTPMSVSVKEPYEIVGEIKGPPPVRAEDPNFGIETETYSGEQIFKVPLRLRASSSVAPPPIEVKIRSQACSDRLCLPARTTTLTVTPEIGPT